MKFATIIVTRSKSCHVKTLHTILRMNIECIRNGHQNEITFVNDDPYAKAKMIENHLPTSDRILFVDFGISIDPDSILELLKPHEDVGCLVLPGVKEGIDWAMFKEKVTTNIDEPIHQMGLNFDTTIDQELSKDIYTVKETSARAWIMNCKHVSTTLKSSKNDKRFGVAMIPPRMDMMFFKFKEVGIKIIAYTAAKLTMTYTHECVSNIINAAGVKVN